MTEIEKTLSDRGSRYGKMQDNAWVTQELMRTIGAHSGFENLTDMHKECFHMIFHKISRAVVGDPNHIDNIHDIIGYAKLLEDYLIEGAASK